MQSAESVAEWIEQTFDPEDEVHRTAAWNLVARSIMLYMDGVCLTWTVTSLLQQAANAPATVERQFPGYAESGLFKRFVIR